ncbi:hypothetical protein [Halarcobacter bivalviorum]|uniref:Uncharacterized protein n=1 Tax=Halarcobacter bivalviorum TaxID=663364 RepID=A0AAX2A944_9BACT|nr:hypothetical protein [Halarcobacter bivalviorum]AXH13232.1 hypothetical protein ABIV_2257 [Halarcobacter bivalviorum]RXK10162.1 hypothetical protein CRV05_07215 [Halarcobacter bivalviorum]
MKSKLFYIVLLLLLSKSIFAKEYDLSSIFTQNFDFKAEVLVVPANVKNSWTNETRVVEKNSSEIKVEDKDYENGNLKEIAYHWYDKNGIRIKYKSASKEYSIKNQNYKASFKNLELGDKGDLPTLYTTQGEMIKSNWELFKEKEELCLKILIKYISSNNLINESIEYNYYLNESGKIKSFIFNYYTGDKIFHLLKVESKEVNYK